MVDVKSITVSDQFGLDSLVIDFTVQDTSEDLFSYSFDLYKSNHQTQQYYLVATDITNFTYRDFSINLKDVCINYYYKVKVTDKITGEFSMSEPYGEYKAGRANTDALAIVEIHNIYLKNVVGNKMSLLKRKRTGQVCTCFDDVRRRSNPISCTVCYGTRYVGGYYPAQEVPVNFLNPPTKVEFFAPNEVGEWEGTPLQLWTQNYPYIQVQDVIIDKSVNIRYIVTNCHPSFMNFYLIRQTLQIQRLPSSNVVYKYPVT